MIYTPRKKLRCDLEWFAKGRADDNELRDIVVVSLPFLSAIARINGCNHGVEHRLSTRHDQVLILTLVESCPGELDYLWLFNGKHHVSGGCWVSNLPCVVEMDIVYKG